MKTLRARLWVLPGPGVGDQLPLPVTDRGLLAYSADRSPKEEDFISLPDGNAYVTFDFWLVEAMILTNETSIKELEI
jgi:hypothetical protein